MRPCCSTGWWRPLGYPPRTATRCGHRATTVRSSPRRSAARGGSSSGVMTDSPWDEAYEIEIDAEARSALDRAVAEFEAIGHGVEQMAPSPEPGYPRGVPHDLAGGRRDDPGRRRGRGAARAAHAVAARARSAGARPASSPRRSRGSRGSRNGSSAGSRPFDAVLTPALALTPRPVGWYDPDDGERNFAQQVQFTPFTSFVNVSGLPAITVPVTETADGVPMGVQLIGRPGGEAVLFALAAQLERRVRRTGRRTARVVRCRPDCSFTWTNGMCQDLGNAYLTSRSGAAPAPGLPQLPRERATRRTARRRTSRGVTFAGDELTGFGTAGLDQRVKVVLPIPERGFADFPDGDDWYRAWRELPRRAPERVPHLHRARGAARGARGRHRIRGCTATSARRRRGRPRPRPATRSCSSGPTS